MTEKTNLTIRLALVSRYTNAKKEATLAVEQSDRDYWDYEMTEIVEAYAEFNDIPIRIAQKILDDCK